jgi:hypothetical protein
LKIDILEEIMKKLLTLLLALTMVLSLAVALTSCGEEPTPTPTPTPTPDDGGTVTPPVGGDEEKPTRATYVITVLDQNGDAVVGAEVSICTVPTDGGEGTCSMPVATDAEGVSTHKNKKIDAYAAQVVIPEGYSHTEQTVDATKRPIVKIAFEGDATTLTIVLTKN